MTFYETDLAFVHDAAFGEYARRIAPEIVRRLRRRGIRRGRIVELGCGGGITAAYLAAHGYALHGIDISPAMIRIARRRVPGAHLRVGSIWSARLPRCIAVLAIGEALTYADADETWRAHGIGRLAALFQRIRAALLNDGLFLFDFMESAEGRTYPARTHVGEGWALRVSATVDRTGRWLTRRIAVSRDIDTGVRRTHETHRVRLLDRDEIERALGAAGFAVRFQRTLGRVRLLRGDVIAVATPRLMRITGTDRS